MLAKNPLKQAPKEEAMALFWTALSWTAFDPLGAGASEKAAKRPSLRVRCRNSITYLC